MKKKQAAKHRYKASSKRKKHKGWVIAGITLLTVFGIIFTGSGIYVWNLFSMVNYDSGEWTSDGYWNSDIDSEDLTDSSAAELPPVISDAASVSEIPVRGNTKSITNILLLGVDATRGTNSYRGLGDTTVILTINTAKKTIQLTSLLRDTLVSIPGQDWNGDGYDDYAKFNAAYARGGFDLTSKTIEQNFRLKIDQYIAVNFDSFIAVVDKIGGVDLELTAAEAKYLSLGKEAKVYHLSGGYALYYSRIRKLDSDFGRTNRQRKMISAIAAKAKTMNIATLNSVLLEILPKVSTNMTPNQLMGYAANSMTYFSYDMSQTYSLPKQGEYKNGSWAGIGSTLDLIDPAASVVALHKFIYS